MQTLTLEINGMTCDHCAQRVEKALRAVKGVSAVRVERESGKAIVTFDSAAATPDALEAAVRKSGYQPTGVA